MTREQIIDQMAAIVAEKMKSFQSDFEKYDRPCILDENNKLPMIWIVGESHTHLLLLGDYRDDFFNNESVRYAYIAQPNIWSYFLESTNYINDWWYLITEDGLQRIDHSQAKNAMEDYIIAAVAEWKAINGPLTMSPRIPVKFRNITLRKLKELIAECRQHGNDSLLNCLRVFHGYERCATDQYIEVTYSQTYNEFVFREFTNGKQGLVGCIVFHGWPENGYQENYSVQLEKRYGWSTHT